MLRLRGQYLTGEFCSSLFLAQNATMTGAPDMELDLMKVLNNWING